MIRMIHRDTGTEIWVHETKVLKYLERGHKLVPPPRPQKKPTKRPAKNTKK